MRKDWQKLADVGLFLSVVVVVVVEMYNCLRIFPKLRKIPPSPVGFYLALFHLIWKEI